MQIDPNARYRSTHEWARMDGDTYICGITDFAQDSLSDVVYVELPEVGSVFEQGEVFGAIESVKSANDLYMPLTGEITAVNGELEDAPELVNDDPYGRGWMISFKASDPNQFSELLDGEAYAESTEN